MLVVSFFAMKAQSVAIFKGETPIAVHQSTEMDSIVFYTDGLSVTPPPAVDPDPDPEPEPDPSPEIKTDTIDAHRCALGTSITYLNDHLEVTGDQVSAGYPTRVLKKLNFRQFSNRAVNGGVLAKAIDMVVMADVYTIEEGINDWGKKTEPGTFDDYLNNTKNNTFAANYRILIDKIYETNPDAKVVMCTPRKGYGFNGYLPETWDQPINGHYLREYVDLVRQIAEYEGIPVADFFNECGGQHNLHRLSYDVALHPNDAGCQLMANVLVQALLKVLP